MAVTTFIPEIWAARMLTELEKALVYGGVANRDYEGEISQAGDTVHINSMVDPTIADYVANTTVISPEDIDTTDQTLLIDQAKYFAFYVDDVDARQAAGGLIEGATQRASFGLRDAADQYLASLYTAAHADNQVGTVAITTGALAYSGLVNLKIRLDNQDVPTEGRWVVVPPWFHGLLLFDSKFIDASASGSTDPLLNGRVGRAAGFDIRVSNNAPAVNATDDTMVVAGHPMAMTFAQQIVKVEAYRPESSFSDAVKGLHVYGAKVVRPAALATIQASVTALA